MRIRILVNYETDSGYLVWAGAVHNAVSGPPFDHGVELKVAGTYIWIPAGTFEVLD